jgi:hypothetical protein
MNVRRTMRSWPAALCLVALAQTTACSSSETPVPSTPAVASSTPSSTPSAVAPSTSAPALDAATAGWMKSFCTEIVRLHDPKTAVGATGETAQQKQVKKAAEYEASATTLNSMVSNLTAAPQPGIANGPAMAMTVIDAFKTLSKAYSDAGASLKAADVTDDASFLAAEEAARLSVTGVEQAIQQTLSTAQPGRELLEVVPECAAMAPRG